MLATPTIYPGMEGGGSLARRPFMPLCNLIRLKVNLMAWNIPAEKPPRRYAVLEYRTVHRYVETTWLPSRSHVTTAGWPAPQHYSSRDRLQTSSGDVAKVYIIVTDYIKDNQGVLQLPYWKCPHIGWRKRDQGVYHALFFYLLTNWRARERRMNGFFPSFSFLVW